MADVEYEVAKRRVEPVTFSIGKTPNEEELGLEAHEYVFTPPKSAVMMLPILEPGEDSNQNLELVKATFDWLSDGLSEEDSDRIWNRLKDPKDDLDTDSLADFIQKLTEKVTGRPTT